MKGQKNVILGGLLMIFAYGLSNNVVGYYIAPVTESMGYTRAAFNLCFTLMSVMSFLAAPVYGWLFMRVPLRRILVVGGIAGAACFWGYACCSHLAAFYGVGVLQGAVQNGCTHMAAAVLVNRYFDERHNGSAMGIVMSGTGVCSMVMSAFLPSFISRFGWRSGYLLCGGLWAVVMLSAAWLVRERPETIGEKGPKEGADKGVSYREALHKGGFYILVLCVLICNIIMISSQHFPAYFQDTGVSVVQSGRLMILFSLALILCKIALGQMYDRLGAVPTITLAYGSFMVGMWILSLETLPALIAGSLLAALGIASSTVLFPLITRKVFGLKEYAPIWGTVSMAVALGVAVGSPVWGAFYDYFGSYHLAFVGAPVLLAVNLALLVDLLRKQYY